MDNDELWKKDTWSYLRENGTPMFAMLGEIVNGLGDSVVDVGCGEALVLKYLSAGTTYLGFDLSARVIERNVMKTRREKTAFVVTDWNEPQIGGVADVVLMCGVLQDISGRFRSDFVQWYIEKLRANFVVVESLQCTDVEQLRTHFTVLKEYTLTLPLTDKDLNVGSRNVLNSRRILVIQGLKDDSSSKPESEGPAGL